MSARNDTWMPLYIGDYLRDTGHLTTTEHGAYLMLLMHAWTRAGVLPADDERLRSIVKMDRREWARSKDTILELFVLDGASYRHRRVDRELANSRAITEQRRAAGIASAEARERRRRGNGKSNEDSSDKSTSDGGVPFVLYPDTTQKVGARITSADECRSSSSDTDYECKIGGNPPIEGNGRSLADGLPVPTNDQRNGRPSQSPSQSKKDSPSLRSGAADDESQSVDKPPDPPPDARTELFGAGLAILCRLTGKPDRGARALLGGLLKRAKDDCASLLEALREAEKLRPADPVAWLTKAADVRGAGAPSKPPAGAYDPDDDWGMNAWIATLPDTKPGEDKLGDVVPCLNGWCLPIVVEDACRAAGIAATERPNLNAIAAWCRDDIRIADAVLDAIERQAGRMTEPIRSLAVFDAAVRSTAGPPAKPTAANGYAPLRGLGTQPPKAPRKPADELVEDDGGNWWGPG